MRTTRCLSGAALLLLQACGGERKADAAAAEPAAAAANPAVLLLCGGDTISVQGSRDTLQLNVSGESFIVALVPSASGVR